LPADAEAELRSALTLAPDNGVLKLGLARAFQAQGKISHALALLDSLTREADAEGAAFVLHARLLLETGEVREAVRQYRRGIDRDPDAADAALAAQLGMTDDDREGDRRQTVDGRVRAAWQEDDEDGEEESEVPGAVERPGIAFTDVGGMDALKEEIRLKIIHPMAHPELYRAYGKSIGGGILLYGPPGCGKTHLARATAGEINAGFLAIGIHEILDMWIGNSERNLHAVFEHARRNRPCVLFFDEVDALAASRADMRHNAGRHLINQFLAELDGAQSSNEELLILGATNAPWHVDAAFRRPGRFDRVLFVPPPDPTAREEILKVHLAGKPVDRVDHAAVARKADGFSGADLKAVVDLAVEGKLQDAIRTGVPTPLATKDLLAAVGRLKPTTREWLATARNHALYANQGGAYDDVLKYLGIEGGAL
jgi:transitional endoplasmic reticulum ATPase